MNNEQYDIGLSFAGEDRKVVEEIAQELIKNNVKVFYDNFEKADLWGKDLYQHLNTVYRDKCKYCLIFISKHYAEKLWTRHELKAAQSRAFTENAEYILPVRLDETNIDGVNSTVGFISLSESSPLEIAELAIKKLKNNN